MKWRRQAVYAAAALTLASPLLAPQLLAFPYKARVGASTVWSERPLPPASTRAVFRRVDALVAASPIAAMPEGRHVFLTDGGWRWRLLTLGGSGFGLTRAVNEAVLINRSDIDADRVWDGATVGGERTLSGVIAHEFCHGMERRRYGLTVDIEKPAWLREGYCDYVARESSLSDADVARLKAQDQSHPALVYFEGRQRVAKALQSNGGSVDKLFATVRS